MNARIIGIILIASGILVLAYSGITYKTRGEPIEIGPLHLETTRSHFIPPVVGAFVLAGGVALLVVAPRRG